MNPRKRIPLPAFRGLSSFTQIGEKYGIGGSPKEPEKICQLFQCLCEL